MIGIWGGSILASYVNQGLRISLGLERVEPECGRGLGGCQQALTAQASLEEEGFHQFFRIRNQKITFLDAEDFVILELSQHSGGSFAGDSRQFG